MERIKNLDRYQKGILLIMLVMALVFAVIYPVIISRVGFEYKDKIFVPSQENGNTVYSAKLYGQQARFTVSADKNVVFQYGDTTYGPYTVKEDPTAIPKYEENAKYMTGVEIRQVGRIMFRGGAMKMRDSYWLYNEDGSFESIKFYYTTSDGFERDENGNIINPVEPSASTILELTNGPQLTHKGEWAVWFLAVFLCVINAVSILFADELFRWNPRLRLRNVDLAEPSDWEIVGRYISWAVIMIMAFATFVMGLVLI